MRASRAATTMPPHATSTGGGPLTTLAPLEPAALAILTARHPNLASATIERAPLTSVEQFGDAPLERLCVREANGNTTRYVIKRVAPLADWLARATRDTLAREYRVLAGGLLAELPQGVSS